MKFYGRLFRLCRFLIRVFYPRYQLEEGARLTDPVVYLCRHFNTSGLFMTVPWLPGRFRIWSLHIYHDWRACYHPMMDYTLTKRFGWSRLRAWLAAVPFSFFMQALVQSARAIPVYRNSLEIIKTYRQSLAALLNQESILIFPDREYTSTSSEITDMYEGFLMVDRLYFKETGKHIPFIPLFADPAVRSIRVGTPVLFSGDVRDPQERRRVLEAIRIQLSGDRASSGPATR